LALPNEGKTLGLDFARKSNTENGEARNMGEKRSEDDVYGAQTVLSLYFDLKSSVPDTGAWNEGDLQGQPANLLRLRRLRALHRVFGLGDRPNELPLGNFILKRSLDRYARLHEMATVGQGRAWDRWLRSDFQLSGIQRLYRLLFGYIEGLDGLMANCRCSLAGTGVELYGQRLIARANAGVLLETSSVRHVLSLILCPEGMTVTESELEAQCEGAWSAGGLREIEWRAAGARLAAEE
jgi:hypothetical protein